MRQQPENIQGIQILRALAATVIALAHSQYGFAGRTSTNFFSWEHMLEAGVDLFFVISGFIMMLVSDPVTGRETTPRLFLTRRIQRIVPLYWCYTLLLVAGAIMVPSLLRWTTVTPGLVLTTLFFIPSYHPTNGNIQPLLSVGWTLQYEMFFYLCFAAILGLKEGARVVAMALLFAGLLIVSSAVGRETALMFFLGNPIVFEFVAGMGVYWLYRRGWVTRRAAVPIAAIVLPALVWFVGSGTAAPIAEVLDQRWLRCIAWGLPALLLFYVGLAVREVPGAVGRALAKVGDASYSLYLSHLFVAAALGQIWAALGQDVSPAFGVLVIMPCCIVAALLSHRFVERPLRTLLRRATGLLPRTPQAWQS